MRPISASRLITFSLLLGLLTLLGVSAANAARVPNAFERELVIEGPIAKEMALLLGLPADSNFETELNLAPDEWVCTMSNCGLRGEKTNHLKWIAGPTPKLILSGQWFDAETGTAEKVPQHYVYSPKLPRGEKGHSFWHSLIEKFAVNQKTTGKFMEEIVTKTTAVDKSPILVVKVYGESEGEFYRILIGIDERSPSERESRLRDYKSCMKKMLDGKLDGGC